MGPEVTGARSPAAYARASGAASNAGNGTPARPPPACCVPLPAPRHREALWACLAHRRPPPPPECARRWNNHLAPGHDKKGHWGEYEDALLFGIVEGIRSQIPDLEETPWSMISEWLPGRTPARGRSALIECSRAQGCPWGALALPSLAVRPLEARSAPARLCGAHSRLRGDRGLAALRCRSLAAAKLLCRPRVADFGAFAARPRL